MAASTEFKTRYTDLLKSCLCASLYDESAWRRIEGPLQMTAGKNPIAGIRRRVIRAILKAFAKRGILLLRARKFNADLRAKGMDWPLFGYTMTGRHRLDALHDCVDKLLADDVPGDIVETGVWRGGSMILATALLEIAGDKSRSVWCADSFEGMPVPTLKGESFSGTEDFSDLDFLNVSLEQVQNNFRRFNLLSDRVKFLKGWFSATLPGAPIGTISLLRLDGDLYESTRDALVPLYPKVSSGGFVIVDDYHSWEGCKKAVDEYRAEQGITSPLVKIDSHSVYWRVE